MAWVDSLVNAGIEVLSKELTLTSNWGGLNSQLIATIAPCNQDGALKGTTSVSAPLDDGNISQQFNWTSPFENFTPESKNPTLAAMLQSGVIVNVIKSIDAKTTETSTSSNPLSKIADFLQQGEGRTGITKMNSVQVFTGHEPMKIDCTLVFRAYSDPFSEVVQPIQALWDMAFPKNLADGDTVLNNIEDAFDNAKDILSGKNPNTNSLVKLVFPSEAPQYVSFKYRGINYSPMVIENISRPLVNPTCTLGDVFATVQISLGTQRSWDVKDLHNSRTSAIDKLVSDSISAVSNLF